MKIPRPVCAIGAFLVPPGVVGLALGGVYLLAAGADSLMGKPPEWVQYISLGLLCIMVAILWLVAARNAHESCLRYWHPEDFPPPDTSNDCANCEGMGTIEIDCPDCLGTGRIVELEEHPEPKAS